MSDETPTTTPAMTPEERASRYEELRRRSQMSRTFAKAKDPSLSVRWVRKNDPIDKAHHEFLGFQMARENPRSPKDSRRFETAIPMKEDGTYECGDVILMVIAKDDYDFYINEGVARSRTQVNAGKSAFVSEAQKAGVLTFDQADAQTGERRPRHPLMR